MMAWRVVRGAGIALGVAAVAPLTWWVTDVVSYDRLEDGDYIWHAPDLTGPERLGIGLGSLSAAVGGALLLVASVRSGRLQRGWFRVLIPIAGVAGYIGLTYSIVTAPVIGANIGGGMLILAGFVAVPTLLGVAATYAVSLRAAAGEPNYGCTTGVSVAGVLIITSVVLTGLITDVNVGPGVLVIVALVAYLAGFAAVTALVGYSTWRIGRWVHGALACQRLKPTPALDE